MREERLAPREECMAPRAIRSARAAESRAALGTFKGRREKRSARPDFRKRDARKTIGEARGVNGADFVAKGSANGSERAARQETGEDESQEKASRESESGAPNSEGGSSCLQAEAP
jgi:hypothetical protein